MQLHLRNKEVNSILKIIPGKPQVISIGGAPGTGKTFLMKTLYRKLRPTTFSFWFHQDLDPADFFKLFAIDYPHFTPLFWKTFNEDERRDLVEYIQEFASILQIDKIPGLPTLSLESLFILFLKKLVDIRPVVFFIDNAKLDAHSLVSEILIRFREDPLNFVVAGQDSLPSGWDVREFRLQNFSKSEVEVFLKHHGISERIDTIFDMTGGNPLKLSMLVRAIKKDKVPLSEISCEVTFKEFQNLSIQQRRILALFLLVKKPLTRSEIDHFFPDHAEALEALTKMEVLSETPEGGYILSHKTWEKCIDKAVRNLAGRLRRKVLRKIIEKEDLWHLCNENLLGQVAKNRVLEEAPNEFLVFLYRKFLKEKKYPMVTRIMEYLIKKTHDAEELDLLLLNYARFLIDVNRIEDVHKIIPGITRGLYRLRVMGKLSHYLQMNDRQDEAMRIIEQMFAAAETEFERQYAEYIRITCRDMSRSESRRGIIEEYSRYIERTPFDELKILATEAMFSRLICLNGWKDVVEAFRVNDAYRNDEPILLCVLNSVVYTGDFDLAREAFDIFESKFLHRTSLMHFTVYTGMKMLLAFARGDHEGFRKSQDHVEDILKIYRNRLYEQEIRKVKLDYYREKGDIQEFERIFNQEEWIEIGCFPHGWHDRFVKVNRAWLLAGKNDLAGAEKLVNEIWPFANLDDMDAYSILNLYRLKGYLEFKKGRREHADRIWTEGVQKFEKWGFRTLVMFFYRYLGRVRGKSFYRKKWKESVLELNAPGWYDDPDERKRMFLSMKGRVQLYTLGDFRVRVPWREVDIREKEVRYKKALDVIGILVASGKHGIRREDILAKVWPDSFTTNPLDIAISNFKSLVWKEVTITEQGRLRLNTEYVDIDAWRFEELARMGLEEPDINTALSVLEEAVDVYKGSFMPQSRNVDVEIYRDYLRNLYRAVSLKLGKIWLMKGEGVKAMLSVYGLLKEDVLDEEANLILAKGYHMMGNRGMALRHLRRFREMYERELGVGVSGEIEGYMRFLEGERVGR